MTGFQWTHRSTASPQNSVGRDPLRLELLVDFGVSILKTVCQPEVLTVFRLAIAESDRAPEIARTLHHGGREANLKTLAALLTKAQERRLVANDDPAALAARYFALLWGRSVAQSPDARAQGANGARNSDPCPCGDGNLVLPQIP